MSSPSGVSDETRSQDSVHASLQFAAGTALSDTVSLVCHIGRLPGGSSTVTSRASNVAYFAWDGGGLMHTLHHWGCEGHHLPWGCQVTQRRVRLAEQTVRRAISGIGRLEAETRHMCEMVEATTAEARSIRGEVKSRIATLAAVADMSRCTHN